MREALDEPLADRITCVDKDNGNRRGRIFRRLSGGRSNRDDYVNPEMN
jgi:hypothetical protein